MKTVALVAEREIELLILGAFLGEKIVDRIYRGVSAPLSQPCPAGSGVMRGVAKSTKFRSGFYEEFLVPRAIVSAVLYSWNAWISRVGGLAVVSEDECIYGQFLYSLFFDFFSSGSN